jgi:hypothetical protein
MRKRMNDRPESYALEVDPASRIGSCNKKAA